MASPERMYHSCCPICRNNDLISKYIINAFTIAQCRFCKLMFVKEQLSQEELDYHYGKSNDGMNADDDCVYLDEGNIENLKYYYRNLRSLILERIPSGSILDIGCNAGCFLDIMEGFDRYGIERSPSHGKITEEKYGENIFIGTFEDYRPPDFLFDCITLQDVLDHMVDPLTALKKCHAMLKPGGLLVVKVHDMSCLYAKTMGKNFYAFLPPLHLFYFNRSALASALERSSFDLVRTKHMGHAMFLSTVLYRLSQGNQNTLFFKLYKKIDRTWLGGRKIYKNLHDIITVFGVKKEAGLK